MLCALLDSIESMVREVRCADITKDGVARAWFARHRIALDERDSPTKEPFEFIIADAQDQTRVEALVCADGLALIRTPAQGPASTLPAAWSRIAHVASGRVHWQLWRREASQEELSVRDSG